ncbi:MAG: hypothetical protein AAGB18_09535 [Pseudomonadota bacterium]
MTTIFTFSYDVADLYRAIGVLGFLTYVATFFALSLGLMTSEHLAYFILNIVAAAMVMVSLIHDFNLASALIQTFWILIGVVAIVLRVRRRRTTRPCNHAARDV